MTATTSKLGADMTDEQINTTALRDHAGKGWAGDCLIPKSTVKRIADELDSLRQLLARQPAAIGKEADDYNRKLRTQLEQEWAEVQKLKAAYAAPLGKEAVTPVRIADAERAAYKVSGHRAGEKWTKAFAEALLATPLAKEARQPAAPEGWKPELLYGPCQNVCWTQDMVPREERIDAVVISHTDYERLLAAPHAAPSVEQDERGAFVIDSGAALKVAERFGFPLNAKTVEFAQAIVKRAGELQARAASTSANVDRFDPYRLKVAEECCERLMSACTDAGCPDGVRMDDWIRENIRSTSSNVAQGAEAVNDETLAPLWDELRYAKDQRAKFTEIMNRALAAPPAQTALTVTPAMVKAAMPWLTGLHHMRNTDAKAHIKEAIKAALAAAQSASGDTK